jgi:hypothetical protein
MTRPLTFILVCIFLSFDIVAQTSDTFLVSKHDVKSFIASIKSKDIRKGMIWVSELPYVLTEKDISHYAASANILLTEQDEKFIRKQLDQMKNLLWDKSLIDSSTFVSQDSINNIFKIKDKEAAWDFFEKKYNSRFYKMSLPIFTKDMQYCVIQIDYFCGSLCGTYLVNIYKREGNEWRLYKNVDYGVS